MSGFSLIELLMVILLISLLSGIVLVSAAKSTKRSMVQNRVNELAQALKYTRGQAMLTREPQKLVLDLEDKTFYIPQKQQTISLPRSLKVTFTAAISGKERDSMGIVLFFPDGSSSGGRIKLNSDDKAWLIGITWLTGEITLEQQVHA
ncbi:MAG: Tfp pilus assembly protein FimT/FimU [Aestuariibacter sp.]